jgi:hypothetical protein
MSNKYYYLYEQTKTVSAHKNMEILSESTTIEGKKKYSFNTVLQESDVKNQNKRIYSQSICEGIVGKLQPKVLNRSLLCEIDHPGGLSGNHEALQRRSTTVEVNNCGAVIRKLHFKNGQILGELETLSSFKGPDLAGLIQDQVNFGFSLRALGSVKTLTDGSVQVCEPFIPITYDRSKNVAYRSDSI